MKQGVVKIIGYEQLPENPELKGLEGFSQEFLDKNGGILRPYARKWASDPLHQWSRIWEYPFVADAIAKYVSRTNARRLRVLDAGSGITFFPYFLKHRFLMLDVICLDYDPLLQSLYAEVNDNTGMQVDFRMRSMDSTGLGNETFDLIYCISVLEHTRNYPDIIREFKRLLKPGGQLVVTFDISLDNRADIPVKEARELLASIQAEFVPTDQQALIEFLGDMAHFSDIVTTGYVKRTYPGRLPWKYPRLSGVLAALRKRAFPILTMKKLAFGCFIFNKA